MVTQTWGKIFRYSHLSITAAYSLKSDKINLLILLSCEAATTVLSLKYLINLALVVSLGDV